MGRSADSSAGPTPGLAVPRAGTQGRHPDFGAPRHSRGLAEPQGCTPGWERGRARSPLCPAAMRKGTRAQRGTWHCPAALRDMAATRPGMAGWGLHQQGSSGQTGAQSTHGMLRGVDKAGRLELKEDRKGSLLGVHTQILVLQPASRIAEAHCTELPQRQAESQSLAGSHAAGQAAPTAGVCPDWRGRKCDSQHRQLCGRAEHPATPEQVRPGANGESSV